MRRPGFRRTPGPDGKSLSRLFQESAARGRDRDLRRQGPLRLPAGVGREISPAPGNGGTHAPGGISRGLMDALYVRRGWTLQGSERKIKILNRRDRRVRREETGSNRVSQ